MNVWTFTGRLGADADLRTTQTGDRVLNFRVANDVGFGDRKTAQWVDCSLWGQRAERLAPHLTRGKGLVISGEVTLREFERRDGTRGAGLAVRVTELDFTGGERDRDERGAGYGNQGSGRAGHGTQSGHGQGGGGGSGPRGGGGGGYTPPGYDGLDDEIPFVIPFDLPRKQTALL